MDTALVDVRQESVKLIGKYCGVQTATLFLMHYKNKSDEEIKVSLKKLMVEILGEDKAVSELGKIGLLTT